MTGDKPSIQFVAAVFQRDIFQRDVLQQQFLVCRRKPGLINAGEWEFPGGKKQSGETSDIALVREIAEELKVQIVVGDALGSYQHQTETRMINLSCFLVTDWIGNFVPSDHDALRWLALSAFETLNLSAADRPFVDRIKSRTAR